MVSLDAKVVALLHDVFEDTKINMDDLKELTPRQREALVLLTKRKGDDYMAYIREIKKNDLAKEVKLADLEHNMDLTRLPEVNEKDRERREKYKKAYETLK